MTPKSAGSLMRIAIPVPDRDCLAIICSPIVITIQFVELISMGASAFGHLNTTALVYRFCGSICLETGKI